MKERPILFSGPMVRALLAGTKTQTRRTCKGARELSCSQDWPLSTCPYGRVGERLWVRETFRQGYGSMSVHYAADPDEVSCGPWNPSIFMPRWASRITLEITDVRVQRLQEISEEDARAEGVPQDLAAVCYVGEGQIRDGKYRVEPHQHIAAADHYACLWESINYKRAPWSSNPWVWALTFRRVRPETGVRG